MRKKLNAAGLMTITVAGALIVSTPAFAEENVAPATDAAAVSVPASAAVGHQANVFANARTLAKDDGRRRHRRHRRHRHRRRHHRHHRHHMRHY